MFAQNKFKKKNNYYDRALICMTCSVIYGFTTANLKAITTLQSPN